MSAIDGIRSSATISVPAGKDVVAVGMEKSGKAVADILAANEKVRQQEARASKQPEQVQSGTETTQAGADSRTIRGVATQAEVLKSVPANDTEFAGLTPQAVLEAGKRQKDNIKPIQAGNAAFAAHLEQGKQQAGGTINVVI